MLEHIAIKRKSYTKEDSLGVGMIALSGMDSKLIVSGGEFGLDKSPEVIE